MSSAVQSILVPLVGLTLASRAVAYGIYIAKRMSIPLTGFFASKTLDDSPTEEILLRTFHEDCHRSGISPDLREISALSIEAICAAMKGAKDSLLLLPRQDSTNGQNSLNTLPESASPSAPVSGD